MTNPTCLPRNWEAFLEEAESTPARNANVPPRVRRSAFVCVLAESDVHANTDGWIWPGDVLTVDLDDVDVPTSDHRTWMVFRDGDRLGLVNPGPTDTPFEAAGVPYGTVVRLERSLAGS